MLIDIGGGSGGVEGLDANVVISELPGGLTKVKSSFKNGRGDEKFRLIYRVK